MKKVNCGLIVSDYDGTLVSSRQTVPQHVKNAIDEYIAAGGVFAVCTGRMLASILPQVRRLGLKGLVVAHQGTVIADIETGNIIKNGEFKIKQAIEICRAVEEFGESVNVYAGDEMYSDHPHDHMFSEYERITGIRTKFITECKMAEFIEKNNLYCQKISSVVAPSGKITLFNHLKNKFEKKYEITYSASVLVEVSPAGDNKGEALKFLAKYYKVPIERTVAIGDNLNDLPMIKAAGVGVSVANGDPVFKREAQIVCASNDEGGVAEIIRIYGLA